MTASQITDIIGQLTLEEKASLCPGSDAWHLQAIERLGISGPMITDGLHGLRKVSDGSPADIYNSIPATCFPPPPDWRRPGTPTSSQRLESH